MALSSSAKRAIAIRRNIARRQAIQVNAAPVAANDNPSVAERALPKALLAACVAAAGFEQHAVY